MTIILDPGGMDLEMLERADWGAAPRRKSPRYTQTRKKLVLHHSAGRTPKDLEQALSDMRAIQDFHQNNNGWTDFAYNFAVPHGVLAQGRSFFHQNGANTPENSTSFSVVILGNTSERAMTDAEKNAVLDLQAYLNLPVEACPGGCGIFGHRDVSPTNCPGDDAYRWLQLGHPRPEVHVCP